MVDDNFESVPLSYLRADRSLFINTQYQLQLDDVADSDVRKGRHWFIDSVAYQPSTRLVFLCEFSFSKSMQGIRNRLKSWANVWNEIEIAIARDSGISQISCVMPWLFVPEETIEKVVRIASSEGFDGSGTFPAVRLTTLEMTLPWRYQFWRREGEAEKPASIPAQMR